MIGRSQNSSHDTSIRQGSVSAHSRRCSPLINAYLMVSSVNKSMRKRQESRTGSSAAQHNEFDVDSFSGHQVPMHYHDEDDEKHEQSDLRGDRGNIAILFFLYLLQGIPLGLTAAIPMLLQNRGASYKQQVSVIHVTQIFPCLIHLLLAPFRPSSVSHIGPSASSCCGHPS